MVKINEISLPDVILAPTSKSHLQRALLLSAIAMAPSRLRGSFEFLPQDVENAIQAIIALGCKVESNDFEISIVPPKRKTPCDSLTLHVGESGFLMRTLSVFGFLFANQLILHGSGTLISRELHLRKEELQALGISIQSGPWPLVLIKTNSWPHSLSIDASQTSQWASGLLMVMASGVGPENLALINPVSLPYLNLTLDAIKERGVRLSYEDSVYRYSQINQISGGVFDIQGDWSGAANVLCMGAIKGGVKMAGLQKGSGQADEIILEVLSDYGAEINWNDAILEVTSHAHHSFTIDLTQAPDLFPVLCVLAGTAQGKSQLFGTHRLKNKESDRLKSSTALLNSLGVKWETIENGVCVHGGINYQNEEIKTFHDHRIVLAALTAQAQGIQIKLEETDSIKKSYPALLNHLKWQYE